MLLAPALEDELAAGMASLGLGDWRAAPKLARFIERLAHWNRVYNLTAVREPQAMVAKHILDSLVILPWLHGTHVLDIGSGAGLPGIPLAIMRPEMTFHLLDNNAKRTRFMTQMVTELALTNVVIVHSRVEDFGPARRFDTITARAFATLAELVAVTRHVLAPAGRLLAMKGRYPEDEIAALPAAVQYTVERLYVPGLDAARHLVVLTGLNHG